MAKLRTIDGYIITAGLLITGCHTARITSRNTNAVQVTEAPVQLNIDNLQPGTPVYNATTVRYNRQGKPALDIQFKEPVVISVADKPEKWGYFQFPHIDRLKDNTIRVQWNLNDDAMEAYGNHKFGVAVSKDGGASFHPAQSNDPLTALILPNGDRLSIHTPKPIPAGELQLPPAVGGSMDTYSKSTTQYYRLQDLPARAQALYFDRLTNKDTAWKTEQATLTDPQAARYTLRGNMPIIWWGDMHLAADKSIVAGVYPGFYVGADGKADPFHHIFFYRSTDNAHRWNIQGRIHYTPDLSIDPQGNKRMGYTEPAYEVLPDGSMICVMRTTDGVGNGPMYVSRSTDKGVTWTKPAVMTASGVLPRLLQLDNGVLVMSSGRPGVQLRFSNDGKGQEWSNPFEMMPWIDYKDQVSCGYTGLLATGPDRFLVVYSDFKYPNDKGEARKAIKVREVIVTPPQGPFVPANDTHIQYEGRVGTTADAAELYWSGSTATIRFTGTGASATLKDYNGQSWFNIIVDNKPVGKIRIDSVKKQYTLAENLSPGTHTITLFKRTQIHKEYKRGYISLYGFTLSPGSKIDKPTPLPLRKMEFYGNSITCGHAIEDTTGGDSGASQYENNYLAYGALTARHYGVRYRCIAKSGIGLMVSFGALIMPEMYDRLNPFDSTSIYDFSNYKPDIVVVNLLQNDAGIFTRPEYEHFKKRFGTTAPPGDSVVLAYRRFITQLRGRYPQAHIICVLGSMGATAAGAPWPGYVREAVAGMHDPKVYTHFFTFMGRAGHPRVKDQEAMAQSLITFIDKTIKW